MAEQWTTLFSPNGGAILIRGDANHPQHMLQILPAEDARLMSAAPEMRNAILELLEMIDARPDIRALLGPKEIARYDYARIALRKAWGVKWYEKHRL